jgi:hypothetical protein
MVKTRYLGGRRFKGSGMRNSLLQKIIENTFLINPATDIYDSGEHYRLDKKLSIRTIRIYYCVENKTCIISHSSTLVDKKEIKQTYLDIKDDLVMFFLGAKHTDRYKDGYQTQLDAEKKYSKMGYHIINVGYSLGSQISKELGEREGSKVDEIIIYNKPVLLADIVNDKPIGTNTYEISTNNDITSTLRPVENYFRDEDDLKNQYVFDSQTNDPFKAHSYQNLGHLDDDHYFGQTPQNIQISNRPNPNESFPDKVKANNKHAMKRSSHNNRSGLNLENYQSPFDKYVLSHLTTNKPSKPNNQNHDQALFLHLQRGGSMNSYHNPSKMTVKQLKEFIKLNRPKGQTGQYQVTNKKKRELQIMVDHLLSSH